MMRALLHISIVALTLIGCGPAQAQTLGLSMFGLLDAALEYSNSDANSTVEGTARAQGQSGLRVQSGVQYGSRLAFAGAHDLGAGTKAVFTIEHRFAVDTGDTLGGNGAVPGSLKYWNARAWAGLDGPWGRITAGRQYVPLFNAFLPIDVTGFGFYNSMDRYFNLRVDNSLQYATPTVGGFTAAFMYAAGESFDTVSRADSWGAGFRWLRDNWIAGAGYMRYGQTNGVAREEWGAGLSYRFAPDTQLGIAYIESDRCGLPTHSYHVSGSMRLAGGTVLLNWARLMQTGLPDSGRWGLSYRVPLSNRTQWYISSGYNADLTRTPSAPLVQFNELRLAVGVLPRF